MTPPLSDEKDKQKQKSITSRKEGIKFCGKLGTNSTLNTPPFDTLLESIGNIIIMIGFWQH
jgi:hypothetical protein